MTTQHTGITAYKRGQVSSGNEWIESQRAHSKKQGVKLNKETKGERFWLENESGSKEGGWLPVGKS